MAEIIDVLPSSPARYKLEPGDVLLRVNDHPINDVLDYQFHTYDERLILTAKSADGNWKLVSVSKAAGEDLGLTFSSYLMDDARDCKNNCVFCFIDQMPDGLRDTLYFKDDDVRLSFLTGNYITLTNLTEDDIARIIAQKISPINISIHATEPELRVRLVGNPDAGRGYAIMQRLADAGIALNAQIVLCPGLNDGTHLSRTMDDLAALLPALHSVSVVPVGLTVHRGGLYPLTAPSAEFAVDTLERIDAIAAECLANHGARVFYPADELLLLAGRALPDDADYDGYPQLENGVGMLTLFSMEFYDALAELSCCDAPQPFSIATGVLAATFLRETLHTLQEKCGTMESYLYPIENNLFGHTITVAGLVSGRDLMEQLCGRNLGGRLLIPRTMLKAGELVFLDDTTVDDVSRALGVPVIPVETTGDALIDAIFAVGTEGANECQNH